MRAAAHLRAKPEPDAASVVRTGVRTLGELSMTAGVLLLLFIVWQLWWTDVVANRAQAETADELVALWDAADEADQSAAGATASAAAAGQEANEVLAELPAAAVALLRIPAFGDDYVRPVLAGTSLGVLEQGIGQYEGVAGPGEVGNFAVAGHRTTYGAPLRGIAELDIGDPIVVETQDSYYVYRVSERSIVLPSDIGVIEPVPNQPGAVPTERLLTLTTCHPMFSARERYIVHAVLDSESPREAGPPAVLAGGVG